LKKSSKKLLLKVGFGNRGASAPSKSKFFLLLFVHKKKFFLKTKRSPTGYLASSWNLVKRAEQNENDLQNQVCTPAQTRP